MGVRQTGMKREEKRGCRYDSIWQTGKEKEEDVILWQIGRRNEKKNSQYGQQKVKREKEMESRDDGMTNRKGKARR